MLAIDLEWGLPIILILVLVLFGGAKIPQLARSLGSAQKEFKKGLEEGHTEGDEKADKADKKSKSE
jgi:sec-independent protein translocase protein TatA